MTSTQIPCSAIVLASHKGDKLWQCLASLEWAAEIIVYTDGTNITVQEIRKYGASLLVQTNGPITNFAATRNRAMLKTNYDWVFFLDSDEIVDIDQHLLDIVNKQLQSDLASGLSIKRSDVFLGKELSFGEAGEREIIRFVRKGRGQWVNAVHEVWQPTGLIMPAKMKILHFAHDSIAEFITDVTHYAALSAHSRPASATVNLLQLLIYPPLKLAYDLLLRQSIRDGWRGIVYSFCMALHSVLVRIFRYEESSAMVRRSVKR